MTGYYNYSNPYSLGFLPEGQSQQNSQQSSMPSIPLGSLMNMFGGEGGGFSGLFGAGGGEAAAGSAGGAESAATAGGLGAAGIAGIVAAAIGANLLASDYNRKKEYGKVGEHQSRDIFHGDFNHPVGTTIRGWLGVGPSAGDRFSAALSGDEEWGHKSYYYAPMMAAEYTDPMSGVVDWVGKKAFGASEQDMIENFWGWIYGSNILEKIFG